MRVEHRTIKVLTLQHNDLMEGGLDDKIRALIAAAESEGNPIVKIEVPRMSVIYGIPVEVVD